MKEQKGRKEICDFLTSADISIADIEVVTRKVPGQSVHVDLAAGKTEMRSEESEENKLLFRHVTENGDAVCDLMDESNGTRNVLFLNRPVLDVLANGQVLVIDELDTSLHTLLVRELVRLFHWPEANPRGAQLIFTTHDTSLLNAHELVRRDQIWTVEKDRDQASSLVALSEFSPRKGEALERGYLRGRYGGVPFGQLRHEALMARANSPKERQRKQLERKLGRRAGYERILIVTEGTKTEPNYFGRSAAPFGCTPRMSASIRGRWARRPSRLSSMRNNRSRREIGTGASSRAPLTKSMRFSIAITMPAIMTP